MQKKVAIQFHASPDDAKIIKDAANERRQSIASFAYIHTLQNAREIVAQKPTTTKARK